MQQSVTTPSEDDLERLAKQVLFVYELAQRKYEATLNGTVADLPALQRLLKDKAFAPSQTWELQSLGLAFGSVLCTSTGLDWVTVEDEYGRDPALAYAETSLLLFPLTMISKRIESGEAVNLRELHDKIVDQVGELQVKLSEGAIGPAKKPRWRFW